MYRRPLMKAVFSRLHLLYASSLPCGKLESLRIISILVFFIFSFFCPKRTALRYRWCCTPLLAATSLNDPFIVNKILTILETIEAKEITSERQYDVCILSFQMRRPTFDSMLFFLDLVDLEQVEVDQIGQIYV